MMETEYQRGYREGAEKMREDASEFVETHTWSRSGRNTDQDGGLIQGVIGGSRVRIALANGIRKLPVTPPQPEAKGEDEEREMREAFAPVFAELKKATEKFPTWPTDPLHAVGVLGEEFGELQKAVLQMTYEPHKTTRDEIRTEAIQTAAMAMRFLASLDAYEYKQQPQHSQAAWKEKSK